MKLPEPIAWHTEDHLTDRSATTYSKDMVYRWQCKGWPVTPLFTEDQLREALAKQEAVMRQALEALEGCAAYTALLDDFTMSASTESIAALKEALK